MNETTAINANTITTLEIAEMMDTTHFDVLKKLEGAKDRKGIIPVLNDRQMSVVDYFIESTYEDAKGEERKCYLVTKMGCDFLANKFTGEKGIIFTAKYVKRFHEMQAEIQAVADMENLSPELQMFGCLFKAMAKNELAAKQAVDSEK